MTDGRNLVGARKKQEALDEEEKFQEAYRELVEQIGNVGVADDAGIIEATWMALDEFDRLQDRIEDLEAENAQLRERLNKLGDIGEKKTSKEEKVAAILTFADNARGEEGRIKVSPADVAGVTGVSERYAYDLVDDVIDEYVWAYDPAEVSRRIDQETPEKGVIVDFERLQEDEESLNKFNNEIGETGVAD